MQENAVRDVLHNAASAASMPERFARPSQIVRKAQARPLWRKRLVSVVAAAAAFLIITASVPGARAMAEDLLKGVVTMWSGMVGDTKARVDWIDPAQLDELIAKGQLEIMGPGPVYLSMDEAAAAAGYRPVETSYPAAKFSDVMVVIRDSDGQRFLFASAHYVVDGSSVYVNTSANLAETDGTWEVIPSPELRIGGSQTEPLEQIEKLKLGDTEAVTYQWPMAPQGKATAVTWLQGGVTVQVMGSDAELVREVAAATVR